MASAVVDVASDSDSEVEVLEPDPYPQALQIQRSASGRSTVNEEPETLVERVGRIRMLLGEVQTLESEYGKYGTRRTQEKGISAEVLAKCMEQIAEWQNILPLFGPLLDLTLLLDNYEEKKRAIDVCQKNLRQQSSPMSEATRKRWVSRREKARVKVVQIHDRVHPLGLENMRKSAQVMATHFKTYEALFKEMPPEENSMRVIESLKDKDLQGYLTKAFLSDVEKQCETALSKFKEWESRFGPEKSSLDRDVAVQELRDCQCSDLLMFGSEDDLKPHKETIERTYGAILKNYRVLTQLREQGSDAFTSLPLSDILCAIKQTKECVAAFCRLSQYYEATGTAELRTRAKLYASAASGTASSSSSCAPISFDEIKRLETAFHDFNDAIFSHEAAVNAAATAVRKAQGSQERKEASERVAAEEEKLTKVRAETKQALPLVIRDFKFERARLHKIIEEDFPEYLGDPAASVAVHGLNSKDFQFLDLQRMPSPESFLSDAIPKTDCPVCFNKVETKHGVACSNGHFLCDECLCGQVNTVTQPGYDAALCKADGGLPCYDTTCDSAPIPAKILAEHVDATIFDSYMKAVRRLVESKTLQENNSKWEKDFERFKEQEQMEGSIKAKVQKHREHIEEKILTVSCPRGHAFIDFVGCFALVCTVCRPSSKFCGWCLADCGADAHAHVAVCPSRLNKKSGQDAYYGSIQAFRQAHKKRREKLLGTYWREKVQTESPDVQQQLKEEITPLITDLTLSKGALSIKGLVSRKKSPPKKTASSSSKRKSTRSSSSSYQDNGREKHRRVVIDLM